MDPILLGLCTINSHVLKGKKCASAGNRTRIDCLEGNHANLYTTDAADMWRDIDVFYLQRVFDRPFCPKLYVNDGIRNRWFKPTVVYN